jgi:hypothetical protein
LVLEVLGLGGGHVWFSEEWGWDGVVVLVFVVGEWVDCSIVLLLEGDGRDARVAKSQSSKRNLSFH